jgi:hypothetical protein
VRLPLLLRITAALAGLATAARGQGDGAARQAALARVPKAHAIALDAAIVKAVEAKNRQGESAAEIRERDRQWTNDPRYPLRATLTQGACADRLRELLKADPAVAEAILMDRQGANVCVSRETSDYWQGDEAKWEKTFRDGIDPFIDVPALDASTGVVAIQLSVPVSQSGERIGALTLTLKVARERPAR